MEMFTFSFCLQYLCVCFKTRIRPPFCQPRRLLCISVVSLMYLETKVERKRLEAASVSSFSTKISPRYHWLPLLQRRHANHLSANQPSRIDHCTFILKGNVKKKKKQKPKAQHQYLLDMHALRHLKCITNMYGELLLLSNYSFKRNV